MPNHEFENYLALVSRLMRLTRFQKDLIRHELRDHLETRISELVESGIERGEATRRALEEFGDAAALANNFQTVFQVTQRRWMMRFATFSIAGTFLAAILVMAMWPSPARFGSPSTSIAQEDPFAANDNNDQDPFGPQDAKAQDPFASGGESAVETVATKRPNRRATRRIMSSDDIDAMLKKPASFVYEEVPFIDVMNEIRQDYQVNVLLDQSVQDDALSEDELVTFHIRNARLSTALRLMLREKNATYLVQDGILRIISLDMASDPEFHRRKIFDCRQLLNEITRNDPRVGTPISMEVLGRGGFGGGGGGGARGGGVFNCVSGPIQLGGGGFGGGHGAGSESDSLNSGLRSELVTIQEDSTPGNDAAAPANTGAKENQQADTDKNVVQQNHVIVKRVTADSILINLVKNSVAPDSWEENGGEGTLMIVGGFMIVTQTELVLDEIESLIDELEQRLK